MRVLILAALALASSACSEPAMPSLPIDLRAESCESSKTYEQLLGLSLTVFIDQLGPPNEDKILDMSKGLSEFQVTQTPRLEAWANGENVRIRQTTWELGTECRFTTWAEDQDGEDKVTDNYLWHRDMIF